MTERPYVLHLPAQGRRAISMHRLAGLYGVRLIDCNVQREGDDLEALMTGAVWPEHALHLRKLEDGQAYPDFRWRRVTDTPSLVEWKGGPHPPGHPGDESPAFEAHWSSRMGEAVIADWRGEVVGFLKSDAAPDDRSVLGIIHEQVLAGRWTA